MSKMKLKLRKVVAIAICLTGFSVSNVLAQDDTTEQCVVINGVKWATRNVDKPGTFAATPEATGMYYQWNSRIGWSATKPIKNSDGGTTWVNIYPTDTVWTKSNDPSPVGWRVPTSDEIQKLLDKDKVNNQWTTVNGIKGRKFTDKKTGNFIFIPAAGARDPFDDGTVGTVGKCGYYWSSTEYVDETVRYRRDYLVRHTEDEDLKMVQKTNEAAYILRTCLKAAHQGYINCIFALNIRPVVREIIEEIVEETIEETTKPNIQNSPQNDRQKYENLQLIKELLDSGVLTQEEFDKEKQKILKSE